MIDPAELEPLREFSAEEQEMWDKLVPYVIEKCEPQSPVMAVDAFALSMIVTGVDMLRRMRVSIEEMGRVLVDDDGNQYPHPLLEEYPKWLEQLIESASRFYLTPRDLVKLGLHPLQA